MTARRRIRRREFLTTAAAGVAGLATGCSQSNRTIDRGTHQAEDEKLEARGPIGGVDALLTDPRAVPSPAFDVAVSVNPPSLLWPADFRRDVRYAVRLSRDREFPAGSTIRADDLSTAFFNLHRRLAPGRWYWQVGPVRSSGEVSWSPTHTFRVTDEATVRLLPPATKVLAACPKGHPRLWATPDETKAIRRAFAQAAARQRFIRQADACLGKPLPSDAATPKKGQDRYQVFKFRRWDSKRLAGRMADAVEWLTSTYLLTDDERYAREAIRRAVHVAGWDPDGFTRPKVSDFADGSCMRAMALAYDTCHGLLTEDQRKLLLEAMKVRAGRWYASNVNNLETRVFRAHIWQHLLMEFTEVAFATLGELPEAAAWASYVYGLWLARFPLMGGDDGGWANGNSYFKVNVDTLLLLPSLMKRLTGVDLMQHAWYRNAPDFLMYTWPPQSVPDGFGDACELREHPRDKRLAFVEELGRRFSNPYALWYVGACLAGERRELDLPAGLTWHRRVHGSPKPASLKPKPPTDLPQAKAFRDVGVVSMHTGLGKTEYDVMVGFRSSPYGAVSHAHACQNAFHIIYGGEPVFLNSGYYIAMADPHTKTWYKATRGHNSVLIDGKGQTDGTEGFGWIARFLNSDRLSYCCGDASAAYGRAGLKRFRRHLVLLRPNLVVVYDDLVADHDARWSWLLHSPTEMRAEGGRCRLVAAAPRADARVDVTGTTPLELRLSTEFDPPAVNWAKKTYRGKKPKVFPDQWHATVEPKRRCRTMRFLSLLQLVPKGASGGFDEPKSGRDGSVRLGGWRIRGQLGADRPASLEIRSEDGKVALAVDVPGFRHGDKTFGESATASILVDAADGEASPQTSADELPEAGRWVANVETSTRRHVSKSPR